MKWAPEQDNRIAELLRAKKTAKEIGAEMGVTRNAIIGRVTRCKMLKAIGFARGSGEKTTDHPRKSIAASTGNRRKTVRGGLVSLNRLKYAPASPKPAPKMVLAQPQTVGVPLLDLGSRQCKFCINDPAERTDGHLFCGETTEVGKSWCAWHERIVWQRREVERAAA